MRDPKKLFLALACNSGLTRKETSESLLTILMNRRPGYEFVVQFGGGSDVGAVRNCLLHQFRTRTDCGLCLFIDCDEQFHVEHLTTLAGWFDKYPQIQIAGGLYPLKGVPVKWSFGYWSRESDIPGLWDVFELAGGFMGLRYDLVEEMIARYPETAYRCEEYAFYGETCYDLAAMGVVTREWRPGDTYARRVPEDFMLSLRARELGHRIYVDPRLQIGHIGALDYLSLLKPGEKLAAAAHF